MSDVQLYLLPLSSSKSSSNVLPSWKMGKGCRDRAGGQRSWVVPPGPGHLPWPQVCWGIPEPWAGVWAQCWTCSRARNLSGMLWSHGSSEAQGVPLCLTGMEVSPLASPSITHSSGSCWSDLALAQCLCWRVWAPTGHTGVGTDSKASLGYSSPERCKVSSLGTAEGSWRWPRQ